MFTVAAFNAAFFLMTFLHIGPWDVYILRKPVLVCLMYVVETLVQHFRLPKFVVWLVGEL